MVESGGLENRGLARVLGFESLTLRQSDKKPESRAFLMLLNVRDSNESVKKRRLDLARF